MARPAKSVNVSSGKISNDDKDARAAEEARLRGGNDALVPPDYLTDEQRKIFMFIKSTLEEATLLGNLDIYILTQTAIVVDRLHQIEMMVNNDASLLSDSKFMRTRDRYSSDFYRCCNELCLSPQSRAKIAIKSAGPSDEKKLTIMDILNEGDDDE